MGKVYYFDKASVTDGVNPSFRCMEIEYVNGFLTGSKNEGEIDDVNYNICNNLEAALKAGAYADIRERLALARVMGELPGTFALLEVSLSQGAGALTEQDLDEIVLKTDKGEPTGIKKLK